MIIDERKKINKEIRKSNDELNDFMNKHSVLSEDSDISYTEFVLETVEDVIEYNKLQNDIKDKQKEFRDESERLSIIYNRINAIKKIRCDKNGKNKII